MMVWRTAEDLDGAWAAISDPNTVAAFKLTLIVTAIAVSSTRSSGSSAGS